jgi:hypothetical protein
MMKFWNNITNSLRKNKNTTKKVAQPAKPATAEDKKSNININSLHSSDTAYCVDCEK